MKHKPATFYYVDKQLCKYQRSQPHYILFVCFLKFIFKQTQVLDDDSRQQLHITLLLFAIMWDVYFPDI